MAVFQPPPTWAEVVLVDQKTKKGSFNPVWLKWFLDLVAFVNDSGGGGGGGVVHNNTTGLQGGQASQYYHLNTVQATAAAAADLAAIIALGTGMLAKTAAATYAARTITGTANQITVAQGSGVAGNPTLSLPVGNVISGVYTPTLTNVANLAASTAYQCQYTEIGSVVIVSGKVDVDPTAPAALTQLGMSLPIASNIGAAEDCGGTAFASGIAGQGAAILGDAANNRAEMDWVAADVTNQPMFFIFSYRII